MKHHLNKIIRFSRNSRQNLILVLELISGLLIVSFFSLVFLKLGDGVLDRDAIFFDTTVTNILISIRNPALTKVMTAITFLGSAQFFALIIVLSVLLFLRKNFRRYSVFSLTIFSGFSLNLFLKETFERPRPNLHPLINENSFSFPSGHAMDSLIFYSALSYLIYRCTNNKKLSINFALISGTVVFLIGISRIYLGVHYPSDILAGYAVGITWFVIVLLLEKTKLFLKLFRNFNF